MSAGANKLTYALKQLRACWDEAAASWKDQVARDFEAGYLQALEDRVQATARAMDQLDEVLQRAKRECTAERD
jgi:hypothetical protein